MSQFQDLTRQKFGRLTVIKRVENKNKQTYWLCRCECGNEKEVNAGNLKSGNVRSCGCLRHETVTKHGLRNTRLNQIWRGIKKRCYNSRSYSYYLYGGRGITMCDEWRNDFLLFYNWAINNGYSDSLSIDRIDVNGNYEPNNCRWATAKEQANNMRVNRLLTYKGQTYTMSEWCNILNMKYVTLFGRLQRGWSIEKAFITPIRKSKRWT